MSTKLLLAAALMAVVASGAAAKAATPTGAAPVGSSDYAFILPPPGECGYYRAWVKQADGTYKSESRRWCTPKA